MKGGTGSCVRKNLRWRDRDFWKSEIKCNLKRNEDGYMALVWLMNSLEMPLANVCGHGDVRIPARDVIMKCCKKVGLKVENLEWH